uniref:Intraflagellar transport protein 88 homolog n=1 Tax=Acrobeloides nanus TaxID=290746 RepID=A0A914DVC1_9BILA
MESARDHTSDDPYAGFNDYDHAYDLENVYEDKEFLQAVARSSHGRRPVTAGLKGPPPAPANVPGTRGGGVERMRTMNMMALRSSLGSRRGAEVARPMTAVRAAGYTSAGRKSTFEGVQGVTGFEKGDESAEEKYKKLEDSVNDILVESILAYDQKNYKQALEKAKEAGRKERAAVKLREQHGVTETNLDLTYMVLFNLAHQYMANNMLNEALNTYQVIVKNKLFANAGRLKINIGNIYFRKKDFGKAVKYYRMALDQVPKVQQKTRIKMLNNIGIALVKLGKYEDALVTFEECMDFHGDYSTALNLILAAYCLDDNEKMREAFQRLVDIPLLIDDEHKYMEQDILSTQLLNNDELRQWERQRKHLAEKTILTASKIISPSISSSFAEGYAWCVEAIKQSVYAPLAIELEMNKAVDLLKQGELQAATEALMAFNNKESKVASAAANNLAMLNIMSGNSKLEEATTLCEQALSLDRYNASALVNRGNIFFINGDMKTAQQYYKEALQVDSACVQALYNLGLANKRLGDYEAALQSFYKLHNMLLNNVQVFCQLASIYESVEDMSQSIDLYTQANSLTPTDPAILAKLANIYDSEGDKSQAFQCHYDSYRYFPPNIEVIEWLGAYYLDAQFAEKAVNYFEKAVLMEPNNIKWQLIMASCQRRSGNFQKALELYRQIHRKFPNNIECLKFLVQLCKDLRMPEEKEYADKLRKVEKVNQLRIQRETDSSQGKRRSPNSTISLPIAPMSQGSSSSRGSIRTPSASARALLERDDPYQITKRNLENVDLSYKDPFGNAPARPKTGNRRADNEDIFDDVDILDDDLLPDGE